MNVNLKIKKANLEAIKAKITRILESDDFDNVLELFDVPCCKKRWYGKTLYSLSQNKVIDLIITNYVKILQTKLGTTKTIYMCRSDDSEVVNLYIKIE